MNAPLFSIISPTFNSGSKLASTFASVLAQEEGLYEFLVIDGGSTDDTPAWLRAQGSAVRWLSEPDAGIYDAMNKGVRLARGGFLYFVGAGDRLRPGVLRAVADRLPPAGSLRFLYGDVDWPTRGGRYGGVFDARRLALENISHQAIFYERGIFDLLGGYDLRYPSCADFALNIRCFRHPSIRVTHLDLVVAEFEGGGVSTGVDHAFYADLPALARRHLGLRAGLRAAYYYSKSFRLPRSVVYRFNRVRRLLSRVP